MAGYITTITSHDIDTRGMRASVNFSDNLRVALKNLVKDVKATPDEFEIINISITLDARGVDT